MNDLTFDQAKARKDELIEKMFSSGQHLSDDEMAELNRCNDIVRRLRALTEGSK